MGNPIAGPLRRVDSIYAPAAKHSGKLVPCYLTICVLVCALGLGADRSAAQNYQYQAGNPAFATSLPVESGSLDLSNGNLHLEIPLGVFPQRGVRPFAASLVYDSRIWLHSPNWTPTNIFPSQAGWRVVTSADPGSVYFSPLQSLDCGLGGTYQTQYTQFTWIESNGTAHTFPVTTYTDLPPQGNDCNSEVPNGSGYSTDSTGYFMQVTNYTQATIYAPDGTQVYPVVKDTNGNFFVFGTSANPGSINYASNPMQDTCQGTIYYVYNSFTWKDPNNVVHSYAITTQAAGTSCATDIPSGSATDSSGFTMQVTNYTNAVVYAPDGTEQYPIMDGNIPFDTLGRMPVKRTLNCNGSSNQTCYDVLNSQDLTGRYTVTTESISVNTAFSLTGAHEYAGSLTAIQKITLPDNTFYLFGYDSYGELSSVTLPTGGQVTYGYTNFKDSFGDINRWVNSRVSGGGTWSYAPYVITNCGSGQVGCQQEVIVSKPSTDTTYYTFTLNNGAWAAKIQYYTGATTLVATQVNTWNFANACSPTPCTGNSNIQKVSSTLTWPNPGGVNVTNAVQYAYDSIYDVNVISVKEWKFYTGTQPTNPDRETDFGYLTTSPYTSKNIINRILSGTVKNGSGGILAQTNFTYDDSGSLINSTPSSGIVQHDDTNFGINNTVRGNVTSVKRCTNVSSCSSTYAQTTMKYDTTGNLLSATDSLNNTTGFGYSDNFFKDSSAANPPATYQTSVPTNAYMTSMNQPLVGMATFGYYYGSGKRASTSDSNGANSFNHFLDSLDRLTHQFGPALSMGRPWVLNAYGSTDTQLDSYLGITDSNASSSCTSCRHDKSALDNLGRLTHSYMVNDPGGQTTIDTTYDTSGRLASSSHPYRSTSDPTYGLESPTYDGLNRITRTTHPDSSFSQVLYGAAVGGTGLNARTTQSCASSTYGLGYPTLFIDESGRMRETWTDGFGRTVEGDEPDSTGKISSGRVVCYLYDLLGNNLQVVSGSQTRTFAYDPLSRVTSVTIPERANSSGSNCPVTFTYDNNSNVKTRVAPAPNQISCAATVTTTYSYDALNRLTIISYSDGTTPTVQNGYDGTALSGCVTSPPSLSDPNPKGRRTSMCDGSGATSWAHDAAGRITTESRTISGVNKTISYAYNLDGTFASVTYPSGKTVTYTVNNAQRLTTAKDTASGTQFALLASYAPTGALQGMITGQVSGGFGGVTETHTYNSRLEYASTQATSSAGTALNLALNYNLTGGDNGSVTSITNNVDNGRTQTFGYDPLNRISSTSSQATSGVDCWGQTFAPDPLGNLDSITSTQCNSTMLGLGVDANNHINNSGFGYDASGNMTQDGSSGVTYFFDAGNRLYKITGISGGPYCYFYDGNGLRVAKKSGANSDCTGGTFIKLYWRSISGVSLAETDSTGSVTNAAYNEYVFFSGRLIASRNGTGSIFYYFADQIGTTRTITTGNGSGQTPGQLCYDADFTPYGLEIQHTERLQTTACPPNYKFTGYERDSETGLDYAFARYYSPRLNRFYSTDPLGGSIGSLQSHNAYAYTLNNPLNTVDPSGQWSCPPGYGQYCGGGARWAGFGLNSWGVLSNTWDEFDLQQLPVVEPSGYYFQVQAGLIPYIAFLPPELYNISSDINPDLANLPIDYVTYFLGTINPPRPPDDDGNPYIKEISRQLAPLSKLSDCTGGAVADEVPFGDKIFNTSDAPADPVGTTLDTAEKFSSNEFPAKIVLGLDKAGLPALSEASENLLTKVVSTLAPYAGKLNVLGWAWAGGKGVYDTAACYNKP
jgi:RHS repeat-associated protein